jgi:hypothetical protein
MDIFLEDVTIFSAARWYRNVYRLLQRPKVIFSLRRLFSDRLNDSDLSKSILNEGWSITCSFSRGEVSQIGFVNTLKITSLHRFSRHKAF